MAIQTKQELRANENYGEMTAGTYRIANPSFWSMYE